MKILILAPHTDDGELGCGGTISKLSKENEVYYLAFSTCGNNALIDEAISATNILNVHQTDFLNFPVRNFDKHRQEILDSMIEYRDKVNPSMVFMPSLNDVHQDHEVVTKEALRAFKFSSLIGYEMPWNNLSFNTNTFIRLSEENVKDKCLALECYRSQAHRPYCNDEFVRSLASVRGVQINTKYAEAFEVMKWIG